jgi:hypothetical protein
MQLGTRWSVGAEPPARLSDSMKAAILSLETQRQTTVNGGHNDASLWRWTLTWLEGHPRAELDDGTIVREDYDGSIIVDTDDRDGTDDRDDRDA